MDELFVDLTPPSGGLADLRTRIGRRRSRRWIPLIAGVAVAALALAVLWPRPPSVEDRLIASLQPLEGSIRLAGEGRLAPVTETETVVMVRWQP